MNEVYIHSEDVHNMTAPRIVVPMLMQLLKPSSVLDVGCGIGTWLRAFEESGLVDYIGVDADYVERSQLKIPIAKFKPEDLRKPWSLGRKFDLVISLEVAEHIDGSVASQFVEGLINHGDLVLFSAAVPGQGGQHHVNEQWASYWISLFRQFDFSPYDVIRPQIWNNPAIEVWYKQNTLLFCKKNHALEKTLSQFQPAFTDIIHPDLFSFYQKQAQRALEFEEGNLGIALAWQSFRKAVLKKISTK